MATDKFTAPANGRQLRLRPRTLSVSGAVLLLAAMLVFAHSAAAQTPTVGATDAALPVAAIQRIIGRDGVMTDDTLRISIPQNDLRMMVDGFLITPPMGMSTWVAFSPGASDLLLGELVVREQDVRAVQRVLAKHDIETVGMDRYFLRALPRVLVLRVQAEGAASDLAVGIRAALDEIGDLRGASPADAREETVTNTFDSEEMSEIFEVEGSTVRGVYRADLPETGWGVAIGGRPLGSVHGLDAWAALQGTTTHGAITGQLVTTPALLATTSRALTNRGLEITNVYRPWMGMSEDVYLVRFWGTGAPAVIAQSVADANRKSQPAQ